MFMGLRIRTVLFPKLVIITMTLNHLKAQSGALSSRERFPKGEASSGKVILLVLEEVAMVLVLVVLGVVEVVFSPIQPEESMIRSRLKTIRLFLRVGPI